MRYELIAGLDWALYNQTHGGGSDGFTIMKGPIKLMSPGD